MPFAAAASATAAGSRSRRVYSLTILCFLLSIIYSSVFVCVCHLTRSHNEPFALTRSLCVWAWDTLKSKEVTRIHTHRARKCLSNECVYRKSNELEWIIVELVAFDTLLAQFDVNGVRLTLIDVSFSVSDSNEKAITEYAFCLHVHHSFTRSHTHSDKQSHLSRMRDQPAELTNRLLASGFAIHFILYCFSLRTSIFLIR